MIDFVKKKKKLCSTKLLGKIREILIFEKIGLPMND